MAISKPRPKGVKGRLVNATELAALLGKSPRTITKYTRQGMPIYRVPGAKKYQIDTAMAFAWLVDQEIAKTVGRKDGEPGDVEIEREYKLSRNLKAKVDAQKASGDLIPYGEARDIYFQAMMVIRSNISSLGNRMSSKLAGMVDKAKIRQYLNDQHRRVLFGAADKLSGFGLDPGRVANSEGWGKDSHPSTGKNPGKVGARRKGTA